MKKLLVILIIAAVACTSVFATDIYLGVMQNLVNTSFIAEAEFDHFGIEGAIGVPVVPIIIGGIQSLVESGSSSVADVPKGESESSSSGFSVVTGVMANAYWKAFDGEKFDFRLGIQADVLGLLSTKGSRIMGTYGASLGFDYKFNDDFSVNFTSAIPFAFILSPFGDEVTKYTAIYYSDTKAEDLGGAIGEVVLALLETIGSVGNQLARLSFKWSI